MNTRDKVIELRQQYPRWTLKDIADICNISKQRVHTILKSENLPTKIFDRAWGKNKYKKCHFCNNLIKRGEGSNYCNEYCKDSALFIHFPCTQCHSIMKMNKKIMLRKVSQLQQYNFFCSRNCYANYRVKKP